MVLVVDARGQGASVAALAEGFAGHRADVTVAGVILNRVASAAHERLLRDALDAHSITVLGAVPRNEALSLPSRHLGLVQACESEGSWVDGAASVVARAVDTDALQALARPLLVTPTEPGAAIPPLGQRVAVARDAAFGFCYEALMEDWRAAGAAVVPFSPLADEAPDPDADAVYLPGGYPELHAGRIAGAARFLDGLRDAAGRGATVFGECGGYMVLGRGLTDADGRRHAMAGLLPLETSFQERRLALGYRYAHGSPATARWARRAPAFAATNSTIVAWSPKRSGAAAVYGPGRHRCAARPCGHDPPAQSLGLLHPFDRPGLRRPRGGAGRAGRRAESDTCRLP